MENQESKDKSFRLSINSPAFGDMSKGEWWKYKSLERKDYGKASLTCLLAGFIIPVLFYVGVVSGVIWVYLTIKEKRQKK